MCVCAPLNPPSRNLHEDHNEHRCLIRSERNLKGVVMVALFVNMHFRVQIATCAPIPFTLLLIQIYLLNHFLKCYPWCRYTPQPFLTFSGECECAQPSFEAASPSTFAQEAGRDPDLGRV